MLLSSFINKKIYGSGACKGTCDGVLITKKSRTVKYLSCLNGQENFYLAFSSIDYATDVIRLNSFHKVTPRGCEKFVFGLPVYDETGKKIGVAKDMDAENLVAVQLILESGEKISAPLISSFHDAILIKKAPPFPLAMRIPLQAKKWLAKNETKERFVTKRTLNAAAKEGNLIKFTLALLSPLDGVFCGEF